MAGTTSVAGARTNVPDNESGDLPNIAIDAPPGMRTLLAFGVENALILVVASTGRLGNILTFASYAAEPLPCLVRHAVHIEARQTRLGPTIYTACLPWVGMPSGRVVLGCITQTGRKPLMAVDAVPYVGKTRSELDALLKPFGSRLSGPFQKVLPRNHPLLKLQSLQPHTQEFRTGTMAEGLQGQFVAVSDGIAEGWVWNSARPAQSQAVQVLHKGQIVGLGMADRFSIELKARGIGDGCYWFKVSLSYELLDGQAHELSVRAVGATDFLPGSPLVAHFQERPQLSATLLSRAEAHRYFVELVQRGNAKHLKAIAVLSNAFLQACIEQETGLFEQARTRYKELKRLLGSNAICDIRIAETWLLQSHPNEALAAYKAALAAEPGSQIAQRGVTSLQPIEYGSAS